jgi:hypothetical protein
MAGETLTGERLAELRVLCRVHAVPDDKKAWTALKRMDKGAYEIATMIRDVPLVLDALAAAEQRADLAEAEAREAHAHETRLNTLQEATQGLLDLAEQRATEAEARADEMDRVNAQLRSWATETRAALLRAETAEAEVERLRKHVCADGHHPTFLRGTCIRCGVGAKETP